MAHIPAGVTAIAIVATRALATALQQLRTKPAKTLAVESVLLGQPAALAVDVLGATALWRTAVRSYGCLLHSSTATLRPEATCQRLLVAGPGIVRHLSRGLSTAAAGSSLANTKCHSGITALASLQSLQPCAHASLRWKHTAGKRRPAPSGAGGQEPERPRRRLPRFKPSPKIMNTVSLVELSTLAAAEAAGWNAKELAAAANRVVMLWQREQPAAAAAAMQGRGMRTLPAAAAGADRDGVAGGGAWGGAAAPAAAAAPVTAAAPPSQTGGWRQLQAGAAGGTSRRGVRAAAVDATLGAGAAGGQPAAPLVCSTSLVQYRLRPSERRLAELVERLVRAARARVGSQDFGPRELSTLLFSLARLGYWQPPLLHLAAGLADYGAERLRRGDAIAAATVMQVLVMARSAASAGQAPAGRLLQLLPPERVAMELMPRLPSCQPRTLAGLLRASVTLLSPDGRRLKLAPPRGSEAAAGGPGAAATSAGTHAEQGSDAGLARTAVPSPGALPAATQPSKAAADAVAALAREVTRECTRRRFVGFGPANLTNIASALAKLRRGGAGSPATGGAAGAGTGGEAGGTDVAGGDSEAWRLLVAAACSPRASEMAGATEQQWRALLGAAKAWGGPSLQELRQAALAAGVTEGTAGTRAARRLTDGS